MLIDTREPPPRPPGEDPEHRRWSIPWSSLGPLWRMLGGLALLLVSAPFPPVESYALILAACVLIARGFGSLIDRAGGLGGMRDYRQ